MLQIRRFYAYDIEVQSREKNKGAAEPRVAQPVP